MESQSQLFEAIFKRPAGNDNNIFLQEVTAQHPYFTPAHFFLLQQTPKIEDNYAQQAAKTALLFNNPHWLQFQLQAPVTATELIITERAVEKMPLSAPESVTAEQDMEQMSPEIEIPVNESSAVETPHIETAITPAEHVDAIAEPQLQKTALPKEMMLFEPMHMVDYFASQGIKLSEEVQTADKLGKQLRSFTEWLKTMKKVHADKLPESSQDTDSTVQYMADKSNTEDEVVTESMAEVFAMQGKTSKAIAVYQKLSLLNPSKSPFFAAKIEQLKG